MEKYKGDELYKDAVHDNTVRKNISKSLTTTYVPGDNVCTSTINEYYLGTIYKWYDVITTTKNKYYYYFDGSNHTIVKYDKPIEIHLFSQNLYHRTTVKEILEHDNSYLLHGRKNKPKRSIGNNPIVVDIQKDEIAELIHDRFGVLEDSTSASCVRLLQSRFFGCYKKDTPFEIDVDTKEQIKRLGIAVKSETGKILTDF